MRDRIDFAALTDRLLSDLSPALPLQVAPELLSRLAAYPWPGNLRQYASVLRTACAMLQDGEETLDWAHMPDDLLDALQAVAPVAAASSPGPAVAAPLGPQPSAMQVPQSLQALSQVAIQQTLEATRGNVSLAARQLGISRQTLYRKLAAASV